MVGGNFADVCKHVQFFLVNLFICIYLYALSPLPHHTTCNMIAVLVVWLGLY